MWCIQKMDAAFRERMYDVLNLYSEPYNPLKPIICVDEKPKQLLFEKRKSLPMKPGTPEKYDYEYVRNGTANIFVAVEFKAGGRFVQVRERRTRKDFAQFLKRLVDGYRGVEVIKVVVDNLNTHGPKSFYETFGREEAKAILDKVEFHYTPKHASWLNVAEVEINVMDVECTRRRIGDRRTLSSEVTAWMKRRNKEKAKIDWKFTREKADLKLSKYYV